MIIYRPHHGSISDAMSFAQVFADADEMKRWIADNAAKIYGWPIPFTIDDIIISDEVMNDTRNGWKDTRRVCVMRFGFERFPFPMCIGHCATDFPHESQYKESQED